VPRVADLPTPEARREATVPARHAARLKRAKVRVSKIATTEPAFTRGELADLAVILLSAGERDG
jgi:hypothetical protein